MNEISKEKSSSVGMDQKIAFGVGMFANQMFPAILGIFMLLFWLKILDLQVGCGLQFFFFLEFLMLLQIH